MRPQLEAIVRAALARQLTVAELNAATRALSLDERKKVLAAIRGLPPRASGLMLVPKQRAATE